MSRTLEIEELIDYLDIDAVHIMINRDGEFGLIAEQGHCGPKGRNWNLLAIYQEKLIPWIVEKALNRLKPLPREEPEDPDCPF